MCGVLAGPCGGCPLSRLTSPPYPTVGERGGGGGGGGGSETREGHYPLLQSEAAGGLDHAERRCKGTSVGRT